MSDQETESLGLVINPIFKPLFVDELDDKGPRYFQLYGGRGSGKSFVAAIAIVQLTFSKFQHKILYLRQTMASSDDSVVADIKAAILLFTAREASTVLIRLALRRLRTSIAIAFLPLIKL